MIDAQHIGQQFGSYTIIEAINSGTFGSVYKAQHAYLKNRPIVAVKILHSHLASQEERERFIGEAQLLSELEHPRILPIKDVGFQNGIPFMIIEYAAGGTLRDRIRQQAGQPFAVDDAVRIITQVGEALQYAHQHEKHIVHRDLKPENILFNANGDALLADFGIAAILETTGTKVMEKSGTPYYMAPEQFEGKVSTKSDQYALGCIAYELLAGRRPYNLDGANAFVAQYQHAKVEPIAPTTYNPRIPAHIEQAIRKAMSKDRANRYPDVAAFIAALSASAKTKQQWQDEWDYTRPRSPTSAINAVKMQAFAAKTKQQWLDEGNARYNAGRYEEALAAYEQGIRLDPNFAVASRNKGYILNELKRYEEALAVCEQAIRLDPNNAWAYYNKGRALNELKRYEEALAAYEQAIRLDPNLVTAYNNKGVALNGLKRYKEALAAFEQAIRLDPSYAYAYYGKGQILDQLRRKAEAQQAYAMARRLGYEG